MHSELVSRRRKWRRGLLGGAAGLFLLGGAVLYFVGQGFGAQLGTVVAVPALLVVIFILMYVAHAVWRCPACERQLGTKSNLPFCPHCGTRLVPVPEGESLAERVRQFQSKSERPVTQSDLEGTLEHHILWKRFAEWGFYGFTGLLVAAWILGPEWRLWGRGLSIIWVLGLVGYGVVDLLNFRCPLCGRHLEKGDRFCLKCGLGNQ